MKRWMLLLLAALLAALPFFCGVSESDTSASDMPTMETEGETNRYTPWVTQDTLLENAGSVWNDGTDQYSISACQSRGFQAVELRPEDAYQALMAAYGENREAGTAKLLSEWGLGSYRPEGYPIRYVLSSDESRMKVGSIHLVNIEIVCFSGWGWGEECSLIFVEEEDGWRLVDCVDAEYVGMHAIDGQDEECIFAEFQTIGHGTGYYTRDIDVYSLDTRRVEASYTAEGHDTFQYWGVQSHGAACYAEDGLHIFRRLSLLEYDEAANDFLPTGSLLDVFDYILDESGSLVLQE